MSTNTNWQDALSALRTSLPEGEDAPVQEEKAAPHPRVDIILEKKGRGGKVATIIAGFTVPDDELLALAATLKQRLGTGGSARGGEILIQGDRRADVQRLLTSLGYKSRLI